MPSGTCATAPVLLVTVSTPAAATFGPHVPVVSTRASRRHVLAKWLGWSLKSPARPPRRYNRRPSVRRRGSQDTAADPMGLYSKAPKKKSLFLMIGPPNTPPMRLLSCRGFDVGAVVDDGLVDGVKISILRVDVGIAIETNSCRS